MPSPAKPKWWDDVVSADSVKLTDDVFLLWGDRVRVLQRDQATKRSRVYARGAVGWVDDSDLGGEALLEFYFIDVGQGDGILLVTPEGHHLLIDGGLERSRQQTGKSAADFVDWKFSTDYVLFGERGDATKNVVRLDAMIASHADWDHYGGLRDLIDRDTKAYAEELDSLDVTVEAFYHPGLCPQEDGTDELGEKDGDHFVRLMGDRGSVEKGLGNDPDGEPRIRGFWKTFMSAVTKQKTSAGQPTPITRLSQKSEFLPGFAVTDNDSGVTIRVLAPIEEDINGKPGLKDLGDEGYNKNGHSVALRLDYKDRRFLLTGDLNDRSHELIIDSYADKQAFEADWSADVAKACHHGSHHVDRRFLQGVHALATVFSSGDANTYDHPRAWVLGAAALYGRVIEAHDHRLKAPLVYATEVARSIALRGVDQLREYENPQTYGPEKEGPTKTVSGKVTVSKWRVVLDRDSAAAPDLPPAAAVRAMRTLIYGLVNVRTDGKRLLFAVRNEGNHSWAIETIEDTEIATAFRMEKPANR
jgi:beta-lactamase superfamily II metal-dependent hydrolase